jgi:hypothetical protein
MGEKHGRWILPTKHLFHACVVILHAVNIRHGTDGFTSPPKEVVLWIFITLKSPSSSAGFEPANLESSGKHNNNNKHRNTQTISYHTITHHNISYHTIPYQRPATSYASVMICNVHVRLVVDHRRHKHISVFFRVRYLLIFLFTKDTGANINPGYIHSIVITRAGTRGRQARQLPRAQRWWGRSD